MREHFIRRGDGSGGWTVEPALYDIVHFGEKDAHLFPYGLHRMDNDEILLLSGVHRGAAYSCVVAHSDDEGETWSEQRDTGVYGRPVATAYLGAGRIVFANETLGRKDITPQWTMSEDYGRTWKTVAPVSPSKSGLPVFGEGDVYLDAAAPHGARRLIQTVAFCPDDFPVGRHTAFVRSSTDGAVTWTDEISPRQWVWEVEHAGKTFQRSVCEGTVARAKMAKWPPC